MFFVKKLSNIYIAKSKFNIFCVCLVYVKNYNVIVTKLFLFGSIYAVIPLAGVLDCCLEISCWLVACAE